MIAEEYFTPNSPNVIHEVIDGEAILISMETGSYYSIDNVGADIWNYISSGLSTSEIVEVIADQYSGDRTQIENGIDQLVKQLQAEHLIVPTEEQSKTDDYAVTKAKDQNKPKFEVPVLHKYTDMEDLLLLDPIHEVDESGWPAKAAE